MADQSTELVKILFRFFSEVLEDWVVETVWALVVNNEKGFYKIDTIPFYAPIAPDDIVLAEYDETEKMLTYKKTISYSANSVVQVIVMDELRAIDEIRIIFNSWDCKSEKLNEGYFVMEILGDKDYNPIRQKLIGLEDSGIIAYAEPVLSERHAYE